MLFLAAKDRHRAEAMQDRWQAMHDETLLRLPQLVPCIGDYAVARPMFDGPAAAIRQHFGGANTTLFGMVASCWLNGEETIPSFRDYQREMIAMPRVNPQASYFLICREVETCGVS